MTRKTAVQCLLAMLGGTTVFSQNTDKNKPGKDKDKGWRLPIPVENTLSTTTSSLTMLESAHVAVYLTDGDLPGINALKVYYKGETRTITAREIWEALA
jgi:hypothetical protein